MKKLFSLLLIALIGTSVFYLQSNAQQENTHQETEQNENVKQHETAATEVAEHGEEHHSSGMYPLLFVIIALIIGAATRHFLRKSPLPYTVTLLIIGILLGIATRLGYLDNLFAGLGEATRWAGHIDPHVILYVFVPTLIFEAVFTMDVHTFRKISTNATILAVPGIIIAMFLTGALAIGIDKTGIGLHNWGWSIALMFGAVISATDPVAVVSLLKELGASKRLATLIEGESLLNDGTAIVLFMVFFAALTGVVSASSPVVEFLRVAVGGTILGLIIGIVAVFWIKRVFNDALVEISIIVAAAYLTFYLAEHTFHISGVLGLVALGIIMAGIGRTRISPEVEHFLHEFWELAAFIANTLIFIVVGIVIGNQTRFTGSDFIILAIIYIGIHVIRAIVIFIFYPLMKRTGYGMPRNNAYVVWWGALRGAIGLALALVVAGIQYQDIPAALQARYTESRFIAIQHEFLFLTAGIVTLTLLVNATTVKWLLNKLGITKIAPAKAMMIADAKQYLRQSAENSIERLKTDRFLSRANWKDVKNYLPEKPEKSVDEYEKIETITETRRRVLEKEKSSYWHQFKNGMLSAKAVRALTEDIDELLDEGDLPSLARREDLEELWKTPKMLSRLQNYPLVGKTAQRLFFERLTFSYDCAKGFLTAQDEAIKLIESMSRSIDTGNTEAQEDLAIIENEINENQIEGQTFIRNIRKNYPEIFTAIATRQAIRSILNYEQRTVERLEKNGRIDSDEAHKMVDSIEERMKKLLYSPPAINLPDTVELLKDIPWLQDIDSKVFKTVVDLFQNRVYAVGDQIIKENTPGDSLFIISRGRVKITANGELLAFLGPGSIIGEMSVLNGLPRTATVTAESPVTALRLKYLKIQRVIQDSEQLRTRIWEIAGHRFAENMFSKMKPFDTWRKKKFKKWLDTGRLMELEDKQEYDLEDEIAVLLSGEATYIDDTKKLKRKIVLNAPAVLKNYIYTFKNNAHIFICSFET